MHCSRIGLKATQLPQAPPTVFYIYRCSGSQRSSHSTLKTFLGEMVVLVKPSPQLGSKAMDGNHHKVEANVLLLGAENVGKSGEHKTELGCLHTEISVMFLWSVLLSLRIIIYYNYLFAALTVRFLTRRFIGEYGDIGTSNKIYYNTIDNEQINYVVYEIAVFNFTMLSFRINIQSY